jgi:hypothetical protein
MRNRDGGVRLPRKQSAHIADKKTNGLDRALSPECHISRRSFSAVHRHPAAQLIFADLAGMFMVNVVAGGRSYRK